VCTHLGTAENEGWISRGLHGASGQGWKRSEYAARIPPKALKEVQQVGAEGDSVPPPKGTEPHAEGTEPNDKKALKEVQSSSSYNSRKNSRDKYVEGSVELQLSELLLGLITDRNPKHKRPNLQEWAKHIGLAIRIEDRTPEELERVIRWCQQDDFWQYNILSTRKLREQFDRLFIEMEAKNGKSVGNRRKGNGSSKGEGATGRKYAEISTVLPAE